MDRRWGSGSKTDPPCGNIRTYGKDLRLVRDLSGILRPAAQHVLQRAERLAVRDRDTGDHSDAGLFEPVSMARTAASSAGGERIRGIENPERSRFRVRPQSCIPIGAYR